VRQVGHFLGRRLELTLEVTVYELNQRFGMRVVGGPLKFAGIRHLEPVSEGTRVTFFGSGGSGGLFKLAEPLLEAAASRQLRRDLAKLKEVLEARPQSSA
jgi:carbon monoxide dehydrogenase subunit G